MMGAGIASPVSLPVLPISKEASSDRIINLPLALYDSCMLGLAVSIFDLVLTLILSCIRGSGSSHLSRPEKDISCSSIASSSSRAALRISSGGVGSVSLSFNLEL